MDIRTLTPRYSVTPQIEPSEVAAIAEAGFAAIICNRPDSENPAPLQASALEDAAKAAGLAFHVLPLTHQTMTAENVAKQAALLEESSGPVLAYCASGTRCSVIWALSQAGTLPTDEILNTTARAGYTLDQLRPQLEMLAVKA